MTSLSRWLLIPFCGIAALGCPATWGVAQWRWNEIQWIYSGTHSDTGIRNAAADWNSNVGLKITIDPFIEYSDIQISDDDSISPALGQTTMYSQEYDQGCYLTLNLCNNYCNNAGVAFYTTVTLNFNGARGSINGTASSWMLTVDQVVEKVMSHEFGHVLDLDDDRNSYDCSAPTIMNPNAPYFCAFSVPQQCDVAQMLSAYWAWSTYTFCTTCGCANCGGGACN